LTHHFSRKFKEQKRGGIILLSSLVAFQGVPYSANYAATKAYVQSLAEGLYHELKPFDVDVLAAAPGPVASGFAEVANMQMSMSLKPSDVGIPILRALGRTSTVLPGFLSKLLVYSLRTAPRSLKVRIMQLIMGGMTEHQRKNERRH
jgi:short-subunit dehydrogenase